VIIVAGEALIDLLPVPGRPRQFDARPGGASFNVAVGVARLGRPVGFLGRIGTDAFGRMLRETLASVGVDMSLTVEAAEATTLGVSTLDERGKAEYGFYASGTADWQWTESELPRMLPAGTRAFYAGGLAMRLMPGAMMLESLLRRTWQRGRSLIFYDPNVRNGLEFMADAERSRVERQLAYAHVVKASEDDIALLYPGREYRDVAADWQRQTSGIVIVTLGPAGAYALTTGGTEIEVPPVDVTVVDTVGAGDAFSAAMLDGLISELSDDVEPAADVARIGVETMRRLLDRASVNAAYTCGRSGAESADAATLEYLLHRAERALPITSDAEPV
jgi:fructokinase